MIYTVTPASIAALVKLEGPFGAQEWVYRAEGKDPAPTPLTAHQGGRWLDLPPIVRQVIEMHFSAVFALAPEHRGDHLLDCGPMVVHVNTPSWAVEVVADRSRTWAGNAVRYATHEEACAAARDLMNRWTLVIEWRVVPVGDPVTPGSAENVPRSKWGHNAPHNFPEPGMSGRISAAMERALADVAANPTDRLTYVAQRHGIALTSLRRALRKQGVAPRPPIAPRGPRGRTVLPLPEPYHFGD